MKKALGAKAALKKLPVYQIDTDSYFLNQDNEGTLEAVGTQEMYRGMLSAGELTLDEAAKKNLKDMDHVAVLGIGKGSTQLTVYIGGVGHNFKLSKGMNLFKTNTYTPATLKTDVADLLKQLADSSACITDKQKPFVLLLKSGALLAKEANKALFNPFFGEEPPK
jgi:hypothetical protein